MTARSIGEIFPDLVKNIQAQQGQQETCFTDAARIVEPRQKKKKKSKKLTITPTNELIFQHNNLIEANYKLSLQEKRIIMWLASRIKPEDEDFKPHQIKAAEFCKMLEIDFSYKYIYDIVKGLMQKIVNIRKLEENSLTMISWIEKTKYWFNDGVIELTFHPELRPYLLKLREKFTALKLSDLMQFSSSHAIRIYELLKQYQNIGERIMSVEDIRLRCGVEHKLKQYSHFKSKILEASQIEINNKSDIEVKFKEIKTGRKITGIKFTIQAKPKVEKPKLITGRDESAYNSHLVTTLRDFGFSRATCYKMLDSNPEFVLHNAIKAVNVEIRKGQVRNPKALLRAAIKEHWREGIFVNRKKK